MKCEWLRLRSGMTVLEGNRQAGIKNELKQALKLILYRVAHPDTFYNDIIQFFSQQNMRKTSPV